MAKKSAARIKMEAAEIKRAAAARREEKKKQSEISATNETTELDRYQSLDAAWREIGLAAPARRALVDDGLFELHGMGPNAIRILTTEMKKADLSFRK
jgi:hypothetical protein